MSNLPTWLAYTLSAVAIAIMTYVVLKVVL